MTIIQERARVSEDSKKSAPKKVTCHLRQEGDVTLVYGTRIPAGKGAQDT